MRRPYMIPALGMPYGMSAIPYDTLKAKQIRDVYLDAYPQLVEFVWFYETYFMHGNGD